MRNIILSIIIVITILISPSLSSAKNITDEAQNLYKKFGNAVYQIRVIDIASNKKTSIGSGFQFNKDGFIATNYHVVAEAIQRPENNRIEFINDNKVKGSLKIITADVIHDIAILKMDKAGRKNISLGSSKLHKGAKIFSIGNPRDISFTIIEGTYNGLSKNSFIDKIHFSGSLNPGMSGGPVIDHKGRAIGVNVSTAGNQISFLVPIEHLKKLFKKYNLDRKNHNFTKNAAKYIEAQLLKEQDKKIKSLLKKKWKEITFGPVIVPEKIDEAITCWGGTSHKEKDKNKFESFYSSCSSQDRIFLDSKFDTGLISYRYNYLIGKDDINLFQFYNIYQQQFSFPSDYKNAGEENVTNFKCNNSFINNAGFKWKASFCIRQYKKYPKIFDMQAYMAKLGTEKIGFTVSLVAQGISKDNSLALYKKFISEIRSAKK